MTVLRSEGKQENGLCGSTQKGKWARDERDWGKLTGCSAREDNQPLHLH